MEMTLYHISKTNLGETATFHPSIPDLSDVSHEDTTIPRVCVCQTLVGCVEALELYMLREDELKDTPLYVYETIIDTESNKLYQPDCDEVPDVWKTGELWILDDVEMNLVKTCKMRRHLSINDHYSRFIFSPVDEDEVIDRVTATTVYGYSRFNFSMIEMDLDPYRSNLTEEPV